jgi:hypothetical protein
MKEEVVSLDQATKEVHEWIDKMDRSAFKDKEGVVPAIEVLIKAVQVGELVFEEKTVTQKLQTPLGDGATTEIVYDFRYSAGDFIKATKNYLDFSPDGVIARLTLVSKAKLPKGVFEKMERHDFLIATQLTVFFYSL